MMFAMMPHPWPEVIDEVAAAGHTYTEDLYDAEFLIFNGAPRDFPSPLPPSIGFVQWPFAGVDRLLSAGTIDGSVRWANAAGVYAQPVAEIALGLMISQLHYLKMAMVDGSFECAREMDTRQQWLFANKTVALFGSGGIGQELIRLLEPFGCRTIAVNRSGRRVKAADETYAIHEAAPVWSQADIVVLSMPLTQETAGMVDANVLSAMKPTSILVNVGRGGLIVTDDLVAALERGEIAGAAMDVTDPEPLPRDHPLWVMDNVTISPHIAAPPSVARMLLAPTIVKNAKAFGQGKTMPTEVNPTIGY